VGTPSSCGKWCTFRVQAPQAMQVKLVIDLHGAYQFFSLHRTDQPEFWESRLYLSAGEYRYCFHVYDGRSLSYLTPADQEMDGLKAVLRVADQPVLIEAREPSACAADSRPAPIGSSLSPRLLAMVESLRHAQAM